MPSETRALSLEVCYHFSGNSTVLAGKVVHKCPQTSEWSQGCLSLSVFLPNPTQPRFGNVTLQIITALSSANLNSHK